MVLKLVSCERCGANDLRRNGNYMVCEYCGSKFLIQSESSIDLVDDVTRLLNKCKTDPKNAKKYANLILDIDPDNTQALKYL